MLSSLRIITALLLLCLSPCAAWAQLRGAVEDEKENPLIGANLYWMGSTTGTTTDANGRFSIADPQAYPARLITSFVGYSSDTTLILAAKEVHIHLKTSVQLSEVTVTEEQRGTNFKLMQPVVVEEMNVHELQKAPCCNLSESFETNASVDVVITDAVSGAKRLQMLGMDGIYIQVQNENMPMATGFWSNHGLSLIPGTWVESIRIGKGPGSVINGYESMAGQINIEYFKPNHTDRLFLNLYGSFGGRIEGNAQLTHEFSPRVGTTLFVHGNGTVRQNDMNDDGFMDSPMRQQYNVLNKWKFIIGKRVEGQIGLRGVYDDHVGGQVGFSPSMAMDPDRPYGIRNTNRTLEAFTKTAYLFPGERDNSMALITNWRINDLNTYFGLRTYTGLERSINANLIYQQMWKDDRHQLRAGLSYLMDDYHEAYEDSAFSRTEHVPGAFAEYTWDLPLKAAIVAGLRVDHNTLFGTFVTPRLHGKYHFRDETVLRIVAGRGQRTPNLFTDNPSMMASSRTILVLGTPRPEVAWTFGGGFTHRFKVLGSPWGIDVSAHHMRFENQLVVDIDSDVRQVRVNNLNGQSFGNNVQVELTMEPVKRLEVKLAYKWNDVRMQIGDLLRLKPMLNQHRMLVNLGYATNFRKWQFDLTAHIRGPARIPSTEGNPHIYHTETESPWFVTLNLQITKRFKRFDVYVGAENLTNYMQHHAIVAANDPYGPFFDATLVWGPMMGINPYIGLRYSLRK